jgi:hypothetical protein
MKNKLKYLCLIPFLLPFPCEEDSALSLENDYLYGTGLIGQWEIQDEAMSDNISDMLPRCCQYFDLFTDFNPKDFTGNFQYTEGSELISEGTFTVNIENNLISFNKTDNTDIVYNFTLYEAQERLIFTFTENSTNVTQTWKKVN